MRLLSSASNENPMNMGGWTAALANAETTRAIQAYHDESRMLAGSSNGRP